MSTPSDWSKAMRAEMAALNLGSADPLPRTRAVGEFESNARARRARVRFWSGVVDSYRFNKGTLEDDRAAYAGIHAERDYGMELIALKYGRTTDV
jgi:hypothetical protein